MRNLKIVFLGTPGFAVASLEKLVESEFDVVGVITAPDKPAGRGRKLSESAVKKCALEHNLRILQPTNLKNTEFLEELRSLEANLFVVVAFRMLPEVVWQMPDYGTFNLHASLLPQYRGAAPINWAVINGETESGATTFFINERIDTGEIIMQERTPIGKAETAGELHDRLMVIGADLVLKTVEMIYAGEVETTVQPESAELKSAPKIHKDTCQINWEEDAEIIFNHIRGLSPYPAAWTQLNNGDNTLVVKIMKAEVERSEHSLDPGLIIAAKKEMKVAVRGGYIQLLEIQLAGKRKMNIQEVLNGLKIEKDARMG